MCGELLRHMYRGRSAADVCQEEYSSTLIKFGFLQGLGVPNVFRHAERQIMCTIHGDDFALCGPAEDLDRLEKALAEECEKSVGPHLGPGVHDPKEARAINRVIRWHEGYIEYEADPRQA